MKFLIFLLPFLFTITSWAEIKSNPVVFSSAGVRIPSLGAGAVYSSSIGKLSVLVPILPAISQEVEVSKAGNDATGDGTATKPYLTVGAALAAITDASDTKRYVIIIHAGNYIEQVTLKSFVYLVAYANDSVRITWNSGSTIIAPNSMAYGGSMLKNIAIENLSVSPSDAAIRVEAQGNLALENCYTIVSDGLGADVSGFLLGTNTSIQSASNDGVIIRNGGAAALDGGIQSGMDATTWDVSVEAGGWMAVQGSLGLYNGRFNPAGTIEYRTATSLLANDSTVSGTTIKDALTALNSGKQATGNYITGLTSDVSASGPGSVAATVNSIGGSGAANVHAAELLANAATDVNTSSTIVKRSAAGSFIASSIGLGVAPSYPLHILQSVAGGVPPVYIKNTSSLGYGGFNFANETIYDANGFGLAGTALGAPFSDNVILFSDSRVSTRGIQILAHGSSSFFDVYVGGSAASNRMMNVSPQNVSVPYGLQLSTSTSQPTCAAPLRGKLWVVQGGVGVADDFQVCIKNSADAYVWKSVSLP